LRSGKTLAEQREAALDRWVAPNTQTENASHLSVQADAKRIVSDAWATSGPFLMPRDHHRNATSG
jgi:hypothetical protein